ncbi:MAG TPA: carboxypeptidase-like regulatory domain-containing protein, partial [Anaerolineales bacterium]|nr:carboxypeptidase-like regulatory domain-containing protein [Anaerolineales bacterium]
INNSTISNNEGGGLFNNGAFILKNTIVAGNTIEDCNGSPYTSEGYNIIRDITACTIIATDGDQFGVDPLLGSFLSDLGFSPPLLNSPAIDAGNDSTCLNVDQRGVPRPQGAACDIGAYERSDSGPAVSISLASGSNQRTPVLTAFPVPLQVAALDAQGSLVSNVSIDFAAPASGPSGTFASTGTNTTSINTDGDGYATTSNFTANDLEGSYTVLAEAPGLGTVLFNLEQFLAPANDNFADAEAINLLPFSATVDNTEASTEPGEPLNCGSRFRSVWYSFTPTEDIAIRISLDSPIGGSAELYLASGPEISDLAFVGCAFSGFPTNFQVQAGQTYYLQVDTFGQAGILQLNAEQITPPANDNFADAEAINSLPFSATVDNTDATVEPGEPLNCGSRFRSVWYSFTPTEDIAIRISLDSPIGGSGSAELYLASGPEISDLAFVGCAHSGFPTNLQVQAGQTYYLRVDTFGQAGILQLNAEQITPPANDNFVSAETINSLPFNLTVDNTDATVEPGESPDCMSRFRSVWYSFSPTENMQVRLNTFGSIAPGNVSIYLASGSSISELTFLTCATGGTSALVQLEAGQTYYLRVDSYGQAGAIQVNMVEAVPPTNDDFADAETVTELPFRTTLEITDATTETGEPQNCHFMNGTAWYSFSPSETMLLRANTLGGSINGNVNIYQSSGSTFADLQFLNCSGPGNSPTFLAEAGQVYYFQVGPAFGESGTVTLNLQQAIPPTNDNFANAEEIESLRFSATVDISDATTEPGESQVCTSMDRTVWYAFTPASTITLRADTLGGISAGVNIYRAGGPGITDLLFEQCAGPGGAITLLAEAGQVYYFQVGSAFGETGTLQFNLNEVTAMSGRVTDAVTGAPLPGDAFPFANVTLLRVCGDGCLESVSSQNADGEGHFLFDNYFGGQLPVGAYQIEVSANLYQTERFGPFEFSGTNLDVGDLPIDPLAAIGSIRGRLLDAATGSPVSGTFTPSVQLYRCTDGNCFEFVNSQTPDSQGGFRFETDFSGNPLTVGTYRVVASADQYHEALTEPFEAGEGMHHTLGNLRITSFPVRFSDVQPCTDLPASGGQCAFSVRIWNGLAAKLRGNAWSLINANLPDSFAGITDFQANQSHSLDLDKGRSRILRFRISVPAARGPSGAFICTRVFAAQGNSLFNTIGFRDLFCFFQSAQGLTLVSPQEAQALAQADVIPASTGTEIEPNNSCQTAQEVGAVPLPFVLDGNLDSSQSPDVDFFRFSGTPGTAISVDLAGASTNQGTLGDPFLGFFNSNCDLVGLNDDFQSLNSHLDITIPADGVFILAATLCCDSGFMGGGNGSYQLTIASIQVISSISGRITDEISGAPLRGDVEPFAFVRLLHCGDFGCFDINSQPADSQGRFHFATDFNGSPLRAGSYQIVASANQYMERQTEPFFVGEAEEYSAGDVALQPFPVRFSDAQSCSLPAQGGTCEFSVRITNGLSTRLNGKAWAMVSGSGTGSFTGFTAFQTDTPRDVKLDPGSSTTLRFRFRLPGSVADGANICSLVYVGQNPNAFFKPVGLNVVFCLVKGEGGFTLMSVQNAQAASQQLQTQMREIALPDPITIKK